MASEAGDDAPSTTTYTVYGSNTSPYSVKLRAYLRFKRLRHEWIVRDFGTQDAFNELAKLPIIPLLVAPDGTVSQDSTPIIEALEAAHPRPSIRPQGTEGEKGNAALGFIAALLEEFADEWGNKWMFHYRWARPVDQVVVGRRLAEELVGLQP
jgi:glutathione S-transferase